MNRIEQKFFILKNKNQKGLIAYITAGDPSLKMTEDWVVQFDRLGVDLIELGIPFSDPLADGAINQWAATRALASGTNVQKILQMTSRIRKKSDIPLILFTYLNPVLQYGYKKFAHDAARVGIDGVLALDLPVEESDEFQFQMNENGLKTIFLVTPTSSVSRIERIALKASGFIYCVSRTGVTGLQQKLPHEVPEIVAKIRKFTTLPIAVGFGVSGSDQAREISKSADAVVVGSAIVKKIEENIGKCGITKKVLTFVNQLVKAVHE